MDIKIESAAFRLAKIYCNESEIPLRFKTQNVEKINKQKSSKASLLETNFLEEVSHWMNVITMMLSKIDNPIAWRFINLSPNVNSDILDIVGCDDFCAFNEYLILRRDIEKCDNDELGSLAWLSLAFQREIEKKINNLSQFDYIPPTVSNINFIALDFETATSDRFSPCEIGLTIVENGKIKDSKSWLIKPFSYPYFNQFNIMIHGITPKDVENEPTFSELWSTIKPLLENKFIIAHNAGFDISVLRQTLEYYNLEFPNLQYSSNGKYVSIEILSDDIIHVETANGTTSDIKLPIYTTYINK